MRAGRSDLEAEVTAAVEAASAIAPLTFDTYDVTTVHDTCA